jgi:hypothetical protein
MLRLSPAEIAKGDYRLAFQWSPLPMLAELSVINRELALSFRQLELA